MKELVEWLTKTCYCRSNESRNGQHVAQVSPRQYVGVLNGHLEAVKQVKQSMDQGIEGIGGGAPMGLGDLEGPEPMEPAQDGLEDEILGVDDEPYRQYKKFWLDPEEEPGRAEVKCLLRHR